MSHHLIHLLLGKLVNACPSSATEIIPVPSLSQTLKASTIPTSSIDHFGTILFDVQCRHKGNNEKWKVKEEVAQASFLVS